jgi:hypothetical protein
MIPAIILFFGMIILPESPRWLATKDRWEECEQVLILTHGKGDPNSPWVAREYQEIKQWLEIERRSKAVSYIELFSPRYINRTHIGLFTQIWSQLTGMNVMMVSEFHNFTGPKSNSSAVLHHLCFRHGRIDWQQLACLVLHPVRD